MTIIRTKQQKEFVILSNSVLQDKNLSIEAIGLWAHCLSRPDDWTFYLSQLCEHFKIGKQKLYKIINELIENGYAFRGQKMDVDVKSLAGKRRVFSKLEYIFFSKKINNEDLERLKIEYPLSNFKKMFPLVENQLAENQLTENHTLLSTYSLPSTDLIQRKESSLSFAKEKGASPPASPPLPPIESFYKEKFEGKIHITEEQRERLVKKYGGVESLVDLFAEKLYRYSLQKPRKFKEYKRHDLVVEDWIDKDALKKDSSTEGKSRAFSGLNDLQQKNWDQNLELVNDLKVNCPEKASGLHFYYKHHVLKDKNNPHFDVSALIEHKDFCQLLGKHLGLNIMKVRFPHG